MRSVAPVAILAVATTFSLHARAEPSDERAPPEAAPSPQASANGGSGNARGRELIYVNAEIGGAYVDLAQKALYAGPQGSLALGVGAGLRLGDWTFGLRGRVAPGSAFTLYQANVEAGYHLRLGAWDPYVGIHGGFTTAAMKQQTLDDGLPAASTTLPAPSGPDVGGSLGTDYYLSPRWSVGADATLDALFLSAPAAFLSASSGPVLVARDQSGVGLALLASVHVGLHFDR